MRPVAPQHSSTFFSLTKSPTFTDHLQLCCKRRLPIAFEEDWDIRFAGQHRRDVYLSERLVYYHTDCTVALVFYQITYLHLRLPRGKGLRSLGLRFFTKFRSWYQATPHASNDAHISIMNAEN